MSVTCRRGAPNTTAPCSGKGECVCGICECNPVSPANPSQRYSGKYCECNDYSCDYANGELCGGKRERRSSCGRFFFSLIWSISMYMYM